MKFFSAPRQLPFLLVFALALCQYGTSARAQSVGLPLWEVGGFAGSLSGPAYPASTERLNRNLEIGRAHV